MEVKTMQKDDKNERYVKNIYAGFTVLGGTAMGIWSFCANRFRYDEMGVIIVLGLISGFALGKICHGILGYIINK